VNSADVVIADHEPEVGEMSRRYLARAGLVPAVVTTPGEALAALAGREADLFVLDLTMPGLGVPAVSRALAAGDRVPAVFLLDRFGIRPRGLSGGASAGPPATRAWLSRPFSPRALVDAVTALLRPGPAPAARAADRGPGVTVAGREVILTRTERAILAALAGQPGRVLGRAELLAALEADRGKRPSGRAIDVYVAQLRAKLGPGAIRTVHGLGYALLAPGGDPPVNTPSPPVPPSPETTPPDGPVSSPGGNANVLRRQTRGGI
jgi:DNA-binding response OmpR family regulator